MYIIQIVRNANHYQGHDLKLRYTSDRVLEKSLSMKNVLLPGLDLALNSEFSPDSGKVNLGLNSTFRYEFLFLCRQKSI